LTFKRNQNTHRNNREQAPNTTQFYTLLEIFVRRTNVFKGQLISIVLFAKLKNVIIVQKQKCDYCVNI
jgi:hypothetical protein